MTTTKAIPLAALAALSLLASGAGAQDKPRSLNDARSGNGTGIVIWEQPKKAPTPPAAPPSAPAVAGVSTGNAPSMNAAKAEPPGSTAAGSALGRIFSTLREQNPPSGKSLGSAKKLDAPSQGIPIPTAPPASAPR